MNSLNRFADPFYCVTRLIVGLMFASHGGQLVLGMFGGMPGSDNMMMQVGGWIQLVGGLLIAFGLLTAGCFHLQWRNGSGLFHDSRGQRPNSDGEVFSDFERRTASIEQRRTGGLLLLVFLVRRLLWRWTLEYRRMD